MKMRLWSVHCLILVLAAMNSSADSYTITIPAGSGLIANQLDNGGNTLNEVLPTAPPGSALIKWNAGTSGFSEYSKSRKGGWSPPATLSPGEGAILYIPQSDYALTFTGTPHVPVLPVTFYPGLNLLSRQTNDIGT